MSDKRKIEPETGTETTGHSWDGIEELNTPLPRWWLWTFYATVVWGVIYTILYPAWPMVSGATAGILGYSTRAEVAAEIERVDHSNAELNDSLVNVDLGVLEDNEQLQRYAIQAGRSVFAANCSQCHGSGAGGVVASGYPNLLDDEWLWGGTMADISYTVRHGIRNEDDPDARFSQMPPFDWMEKDELNATTHFVRSLSNLDHDAEAAETGAALYADNCAVCHGAEGQGDRSMGAPNLADAIWLRGGSHDAILKQLKAPRMGVMPPWGDRLGEAEVRAVTAYVHGLGGGEEAPEEAVTEAEETPTENEAAPAD